MLVVVCWWCLGLWGVDFSCVCLMHCVSGMGGHWWEVAIDAGVAFGRFVFVICYGCGCLGNELC